MFTSVPLVYQCLHLMSVRPNTNSHPALGRLKEPLRRTSNAAAIKGAVNPVSLLSPPARVSTAILKNASLDKSVL